MNINDRFKETVVVPGETLGVIEEFIPIDNIYTQNGYLISSIVGRPSYNLKEHTLSVIPLKANKPLVPKKNDIVYAQVIRVKENIAFLAIYEIEGKGVIQVPFSGILYIAHISSTFIKDIYDVVRLGDIIRAKVISNRGPPFMVTTKGREFGVVYALCPYCMTPLRKRGLYLYCMKCKRTSKRKVSSLYLIK